MVPKTSGAVPGNEAVPIALYFDMDDKSKTRPQDAQRINVQEDYELRDWSARFKVSIEALKDAVAKVGPMAKDVERELGNKK